MLLDNQLTEALEYLGEYEGSLNLSEKMIFSSHYKIDVIIRYFYTMARENGVSISVNITLGVPPLPTRDGFMSAKKAGRKGLGLSSIQAIAQSYGGDARFEVMNSTTFSSQVLLNNRAQEDRPLHGIASPD